MGRNIRVRGSLGYCLKSNCGVLSGRAERIFEQDAWSRDQILTLINNQLESAKMIGDRWWISALAPLA
jgi:hypothetical protein